MGARRGERPQYRRCQWGRGRGGRGEGRPQRSAGRLAHAPRSGKDSEKRAARGEWGRHQSHPLAGAQPGLHLSGGAQVRLPGISAPPDGERERPRATPQLHAAAHRRQLAAPVRRGRAGEARRDALGRGLRERPCGTARGRDRRDQIAHSPSLQCAGGATPVGPGEDARRGVSAEPRRAPPLGCPLILRQHGQAQRGRGPVLAPQLPRLPLRAVRAETRRHCGRQRALLQPAASRLPQRRGHAHTQGPGGGLPDQHQLLNGLQERLPQVSQGPAGPNQGQEGYSRRGGGSGGSGV
mmetsp:Transcript_22238/g.49493  ORF Transcript_22238/g.49493 Transcript_22238/m.49493 type:complete len:295 (+) Transcript_22238:743-1627(+)